MIRALIIDDEEYCYEALETLLQTCCPEVEVLGHYSNGVDGMAAIIQKQPDLVFLDVEMPKMNGFDMLAGLPAVNFEIIFTTSYDKYALKAIRFSAIDYLLKPIDEDELKKAVDKVIRRSGSLITQQLEVLMQKVRHPSLPMKKIALPTMEGLQMIMIDQIVYCESDSNYTILYLKERRKIIVSSTLKDIEELLSEYSFVRVHRCYLINLNEVDKYVRGEGGFLVMADGSSVDVSRSRKEELLKKLLPGRV